MTVRRFRGEYSEGLLLPLSDFVEDGTLMLWVEADGNITYFIDMGPTISRARVREGHDLADYLGITHYNPPEPTDEQTEKPTVRSKTLKGFIYRFLRRLTHGRWPAFYTESVKVVDDFRPEYDVESFKKYPRALEEGERVIITEKSHGSNARYTFEDGKMYAGTRKTWKNEKSQCIWRKVLAEFPAIELFCRQNPGWTIYGEVVPTQKGWNYGFTADKPGFFMFDVMRPDGTFVNMGTEAEFMPLILFDIPLVPLVFDGPFNLVEATAMAEVKGREGVVIRPVNERSIRGLGRVHLKIVSNAFLEKDNK